MVSHSKRAGQRRVNRERGGAPSRAAFQEAGRSPNRLIGRAKSFDAGLTAPMCLLDVAKTADREERTMRGMSGLAVVAAVLTAMAAARAEWPRSSQYQPDFSTCSSSRDACVIGTTRRGNDQIRCEKAFQTCMRTGTWDTYGRYGRRVEGIARR